MPLSLEEPDRPLEELLKAVRAEIARAGELPSERDLSERLRIKRHRLRRTLQLLRQSGEIPQPTPGRRRSPGAPLGQSLARLTNPIEIIEMRSILEPAFARLAAIRASALDIARISQAATTPQNSDYGLADAAFHQAVATGARNGFAAAIYDIVRKVGRDTRLKLGNVPPVCATRLAKRDAEHGAIASAIAQRDPDQAERAMRSHLAAVQRQINDRLTPGASAA